MLITVVDINKLKPYELNAKKHDRKQIENVAESIKQFGWQQPIVVDKDYVIIIGHCRFEAAKLLKLPNVPVHVADDLTEEQVKKLRVIDNKTNESDWDLDLLFSDVGNLKFDGFDIDFGFVEEKKELEEDNFDFDKAYETLEFKTKPGDIYQLGRHRLMCGDSTKEEDVNNLVDGADMDLLLTDPPYNVDYTANGTRDGIENDAFGSPEEFCEFLTKAFLNANDHMKAGASFYIYFAGRFAEEVIRACKNVGFDPRHLLIWKKDSLVLGRCDYQYIHEPFIYGFKEGAAHSWFNDRKQLSVVEFPRPKVSKLHPTMKPLALFAYQMQNNTKEGDLVMDLFGGSGTTLIVAEEINRKCYMMEKDPKYADVIIARWEELTGKKAVKIN